jgi:sulfite exporter TauE/SafE
MRCARTWATTPRILTYAFLGALARAVGGGIGMLGRLAGLASGARVFAGTAMIVAGILMIGLLPSNGLVTIQQRGVTARFRRLVGRRLLAPNGKFTLGLTLGFLPCGLVYAALLKAVDSGSALWGAGTMLAFGAGTAVALLSIGRVFFRPASPLEQSPGRRFPDAGRRPAGMARPDGPGVP